MFKPKLLKQEQGFTLVEVLVAILITTIFVGVAMQSMVIAAVFKARARQYAEATTWIQEDLEDVKYKAAKLQYTSLITNASSTSTLQVASVDGFQAGDNLMVGTDSTDNTIATNGVNTTTKILTLNAALDTNWLTNTVVVAITKCKPPSGSPNAGFAKYLQDNLQDLSNGGGNPNTGTKMILGKNYTLTRTANVKNVEPYAVLELNYSVAPQGGGSAIATMYTEVIPNAALQCPS